MKYLSIDIETTGLEKDRYQILSIGAILEDTEKKLSFDKIPKFNAAILHHEITGSPFALNMNRDLLDKIARYQNAKDEDEKKKISEETGMIFCQENEVVEKFFHFLCDNGIYDISSTQIPGGMVKIIEGKAYPALSSKMKPVSITVAGKNFGTFDKVFLERLPRWQQVIRIKQKIIDPGVLFIDWKNDTQVPSLDTCKMRAGISGGVTHDALEDAWDVVQLLRKFY